MPTFRDQILRVAIREIFPRHSAVPGISRVIAIRRCGVFSNVYMMSRLFFSKSITKTFKIKQPQPAELVYNINTDITGSDIFF